MVALAAIFGMVVAPRAFNEAAQMMSYEPVTKLGYTAVDSTDQHDRPTSAGL